MTTTTTTKAAAAAKKKGTKRKAAAVKKKKKPKPAAPLAALLLKKGGKPTRPRRPVGRPLTVGSPEEWDERTDAYVAACAEYGEPLTWTGLALAMGLTSRQSFYDYEKRADFSYSVKRSRLLVEHEYEKRLAWNNPTGSIFALKNAKWTDRQDVALTGADGGPIQVEDVTLVRTRIANRLAGIASRVGSQPSGNGSGGVLSGANGNGTTSP